MSKKKKFDVWYYTNGDPIKYGWLDDTPSPDEEEGYRAAVNEHRIRESQILAGNKK